MRKGFDDDDDEGQGFNLDDFDVEDDGQGEQPESDYLYDDEDDGFNMERDVQDNDGERQGLLNQHIGSMGLKQLGITDQERDGDGQDDYYDYDEEFEASGNEPSQDS